MPHPSRSRRALACALALLFGAPALSVAVPSGADHAAADVHVDEAHGAHDAAVAHTDDGLASRAGPSDVLPARRYALMVPSRELVAAPADAPDHAPGHPPPKRAPARSPPTSV